MGSLATTGKGNMGATSGDDGRGYGIGGAGSTVTGVPTGGIAIFGGAGVCAGAQLGHVCRPLLSPAEARNRLANKEPWRSLPRNMSTLHQKREGKGKLLVSSCGR